MSPAIESKRTNGCSIDFFCKSLGIVPSALVTKLATRIVDAALRRPIVDVACGSGRNAILLAHLGAEVICVDRDLTGLAAECQRLGATPFRSTLTRIKPFQLDLIGSSWPFSTGSVGGIINVHFTHTPLFASFTDSLGAGGTLLLQTIPGHGGNYRALPKAGALRNVFGSSFLIELYEERKVGPNDVDAVTVQLFGKRLGQIAG